MTTVVIDGVEYVPKGTVVSKECMDALAEIYRTAFCWAVYDPDDRVEHLQEVWEKIKIANKELRFKQ